MNTTIGIIYAGGTFGSHGQPLKSLEPTLFLPILQNILQSAFQDNEKKSDWQIIPNDVVKDSSQLSPSDFAHFYALILQHYQQGIRQFVLLTGTDTLSYLSAFLAESLAKSDICVVVTGAMQPLLQPLSPNYAVNPDSDANENLLQSCRLATIGKAGVQVCFSHENWSAQTVQKIHSHDINAFTGHHHTGYPANSFVPLSNAEREKWLSLHINDINKTIANLQKANIITLFVSPTHADNLATQLKHILTQQPTALILLGFGAGNLPHNADVEQALLQAQQQECLVAISTQCPFGGVSASYDAGAWLGRCGVLPTGCLTIPAVFARLLWLSASEINYQEKLNHWKQYLNDN